MSFKRYIVVFVITGCIFAFTFWLSNQLSSGKIQEVHDLEDQIALNILSTETRYSLLQDSSCDHVTSDNTNDIGLNSELTDMVHRVKFMANQLGAQNDKVMALKKYYTLLQIKDYLLTKELYNRCGTHIVSILYLYQDDACEECVKQSIILDDLASRYPEIRVYWIDKDLQTPALDTLVSMLHIKKAPSIVIKDKVYDSLQTTADIESYIPQIADWKKAAERMEAEKNMPSSTTPTPSTTKDKVK
jgi:hypothetical protein